MSSRLLLGLAIVAVATAGGFIAQRMLADQPTIRAVDAPAAAAATGFGSPAKANANSAAEDGGAGDADVSDAPARRKIPDRVPSITLTDREGVTRNLTDWNGRPLLINFWATWCGPCREEIPLLKSLRHERASERLEVIGIAVDTREEVLKYAREIGIDYPILIGEQDGYAAAEAFGVSLVLPFSVFADEQGRIVTLKVGELHPEEAAFILDRVRDVGANRLGLADARQQIAAKMRDLAVERGKSAAATG